MARKYREPQVIAMWCLVLAILIMGLAVALFAVTS